MRAFTAATVERRRCALYLALFIYLVLAGVEAYTVSPYVDEAFQASPAHNLITEGHMGTSILEETSTWRKGMSLKGINRYTYWVMPLHFVAQAGWYEVAGFGLLQLRALSMVWGLLALMSCYLLVKTLTGDERPAILIVALLSVDGVFLDAASFGRADMMAAALGFAGLAVYMRLRGKRFALAIVLANALIAGAVFTHLAAMPALLGLVFLGVFFDFRRSRPHHLCLGALPYLAIGAGWGLYILQYPAGFREQFGSNFAGRIGDPVSLWALVAGELTLRYLPSFGFAADSSLAGHFKMLVLAAYPVATLACVLTPGIRSQKGYQALLILTGLFVTTLTLERTKQAFYLIEVIPLWTAVVAAWLCWAWTHHTIPRVLIGLAVCCLLAIQLGRAVQLARKDTFHTEYQPVAQYLLRNTLESETVMGSAIFAFSLGFDRANLIDDLHLGYYSRKQANVVVMDKRYQEYLDHYVERRAPDVSRYIHDLLGKYRVIYEQSSYRIYHR